MRRQNYNTGVYNAHERGAKHLLSVGRAVSRCNLFFIFFLLISFYVFISGRESRESQASTIQRRASRERLLACFVMLWQQQGQLKLVIYSHNLLGVYTALQYLRA